MIDSPILSKLRDMWPGLHPVVRIPLIAWMLVRFISLLPVDSIGENPNG